MFNLRPIVPWSSIRNCAPIGRATKQKTGRISYSSVPFDNHYKITPSPTASCISAIRPVLIIPVIFTTSSGTRNYDSEQKQMKGIRIRFSSVFFVTFKNNFVPTLFFVNLLSNRAGGNGPAGTLELLKPALQPIKVDTVANGVMKLLG